MVNATKKSTSSIRESLMSGLLFKVQTHHLDMMILYWSPSRKTKFINLTNQSSGWLIQEILKQSETIRSETIRSSTTKKSESINIPLSQETTFRQKRYNAHLYDVIHMLIPTISLVLLSILFLSWTFGSLKRS